MTASLDPAVFFAAARLNPFRGHLTPSQVTGIEAILGACPPDLGTEELAYCLATTFHETAATMQPIEEYGRGKGKAYGPTGFWGRGFVQLTWQTNYTRATQELRKRGVITGTEDLVRSPNLAMRPDVAAAILFYGMIEGWFTGKKLADYFAGTRNDPVNARRIVNGTDQAEKIAGHHRDFLTALRAAGHRPGAVAKAVPVPPVEIAPVPPLPPTASPMAEAIDKIPVPAPPPAPPVSWWAKAWAKVTGKAA